MKFKQILISAFFAAWCIAGLNTAMAQDRLPREYTNPDEVVTFDRTTTFSRAIDVINQFAQDYAGKIIIDRSATEGPIGLTIPPMHWREALNLILEAKYLQMVEQPDYFEIVPARSPQATPASARQGTAVPDTALTIDSKEVRINAIFFEGNRRALQEIGVDWSTLTENIPENIGGFVNQQQGGGSGGGGGGGGGGAGGGQQGQLPDVGNFDGPFVSVNSKGAQSVSQNVFNSIVNFNDVFGTGISVQALFSAFEADNLGEILASPSVKVLEGQEGHIQVGQDFSIKQRDFAGNVTDQFFSVGTILNVTPQIIERDDTTFIHLDIEAERSSAQPDPVSTIINKQNATTQSLLLNDEATVIAGLYRTEASEVRRGIPILKDLPPWFFGLRYIFGYNSKDYQTRELVIIIQASIEPGIPERVGKEKKGRFEVLKDERQRIHNDIKRYRNSGEDDVTPVRGDIDSLEGNPEEPREDRELLDSTGNEAREDSTEIKEARQENEKLESKVEVLERELKKMQKEMEQSREKVDDKPETDKAENHKIELKEVETEEAEGNSEGSQEKKTEAVKSVEREHKAANVIEAEEEKSEVTPQEDAATVKPEENQLEPQEEKTAKAEKEEPVEPKSEKKTAKSVSETQVTKEPEKAADYNLVSGNTESYLFYIIGASFYSIANAKKYQEKLSGQGYESLVLKRESSDYYMVAYQGYSQWSDAKQAYDKLKKAENEDVWVLENR